MSFSFPKVKGFKKDKRNLIESTNNLVVFGQSQTAHEVLTAGHKGKRLLRRGTLRQRRSRSNKPSSSVFPLGPRSTTQKLDKVFQKVDLTNYFANTKPWNNPDNKKSSSQLKQTSQNQIHNELTAAAAAIYSGPGGSISDVPASSLQLIQKHASDILSELSPKPAPVVEFKSPSSTFVKDIVCPVCLKGFEPSTFSRAPVADVMNHSLQAHQLQNGTIFRKTLEEGWGAAVKPKYVMEPQDVVVASNCGELFHKLCLRDWCSRGHRKSPRSGKPIASCPNCNKELKYTMCQEIETIRSFTREHTVLQKEFIKVKHINKELQILWPETNNYLAKIKREIQDSETLYGQIRSKRRILKAELKQLTAEDLSIVMAKVTDGTALKTSLERQEKALAFMQQETLQIMRMYLLTILRKLKESSIPVPSSGDFTFLPEYVALIGRVPPCLVPYIQDIVNDNDALASLSHILAPWQGEEMDEAKLGKLELELLKKFAQPSPERSRPSTYVVNSSAAEVGDSEPDDVDVTPKKLQVLPSVEKEDKNLVDSSLKASTATHEISTIPSSSTPESALRAQPLSNVTVAFAQKPPKIIEILKIEESKDTIRSASLEEKLLNIQIQISPNGGGSVDNTYNVELVSPTISSASSVQQALNVGELSLVEISNESVPLPLTNSVGETTKSLHLYEEDSTYVRAIRHLMETSDNTVKVPQVTPLTGVSITILNSIAVPDEEPASKPISPEEKGDVIKLHNGDSNSAPTSSANSETTQLNDMLNEYKIRKQNILSNKNSIEDEKDSPSSTLRNNNHQPCYRKELETSSSSVNARPRPPNNTGINSILGSQTKQKISKENESSWATLSTDDEKECPVLPPNNTISKKRSSKRSPHPKTQPHIHYPNQDTTGATCDTSNCKIKSPPKITGSCEPVYTEGYKKTEMLPPPAMKLLESDEHSDNNFNKLKSKYDQVSIAIMYIIEDDEGDEDGDDEQEDSEGEYEKRKERCKTSANGKELKDDDNEGFNSSKELLPLPLLPKKVLSPIYLTAEKSSAYSIITANETLPQTPIILPPSPPQQKDVPRIELPSPWTWPQQSRMIPVDHPSNTKLHVSADDPDQTLFPSCHHSLLRRSATSLQLPPLPEEIMEQLQSRNSDGIVPTLFYENETRLSSSNKTLPAN